jgi:hypothetical protein
VPFVVAAGLALLLLYFVTTEKYTATLGKKIGQRRDID